MPRSGRIIFIIESQPNNNCFYTLAHKVFRRMDGYVLVQQQSATQRIIAFDFLLTIDVKLLTHSPYNPDQSWRDGWPFRSLELYENRYNLVWGKYQKD